MQVQIGGSVACSFSFRSMTGALGVSRLCSAGALDLSSGFRVCKRVRQDTGIVGQAQYRCVADSMISVFAYLTTGTVMPWWKSHATIMATGMTKIKSATK